MVKVVYILHRRDDVTPQDFYAYWKNNHGPLVRSFAKAIRAIRYVQSHTIDTPINDALRASRDTEPRYDGVAELWWDSLDELMGAATKDPKWQEASLALLEDEKKFIDLANSPLLVATERPVVDGDIR